MNSRIIKVKISNHEVRIYEDDLRRIHYLRPNLFPHIPTYQNSIISQENSNISL